MLSKMTPAELQFVVPLEIHGDDAELHKRRSFSISTVSSALTTGSTWGPQAVAELFRQQLCRRVDIDGNVIVGSAGA